MIELCRCAILLLLLLCLFYIWGWIPKMLCRVNIESITQQMLLGFFVYFLIFQIVALPMVLFKQTLTSLSILWMVVMLVITIGTLFWVRQKKLPFLIGQPWNEDKKTKAVLAVALVVVAVTILFSIIQEYNGWDTAFYLGTMNDAVQSDMMYLMDGNDGTMRSEIDLRYALSMFYAQFMVWCKVLHIHARVMAFIVMRALCVVMSSMIVYLIGKKLFSNVRKRAAWLVIFWMGLNFFWTATHSTAFFLFIRGYEAKGYCANVLLPALLYAFLCLFLAKDKRDSWYMVGLITFASVPVSMSALAIAPVAVAITGLALMISSKKFWPIFFRCFICVVPNIIYLLIYFLYAKDMISIGV